MARLLIILLLCLIPSCAWGDKLAYYSDYFSFIGSDAAGFVAFALDNNRGVDGTDYQAEHFGVLYDQHSGWVRLAGMGKYENPRGMLSRIPDSPDFQFEGRPESGLVIRSGANALTLTIAPIEIHLQEAGPKRTEKWGSAEASLHWRNREIPGRVIYEGLVRLDWNRLTRTYFNTWDNFQGFYLALEQGAPGAWRDLYLRSQGNGKHRRTKGFVTIQDWNGTIRSTRFEAFDKALNFGFFRWPQRWAIDIVPDRAASPETGELKLSQISRQNQRNWIIGGFAMTVVKGELLENGKKFPVLGFVELIK